MSEEKVLTLRGKKAVRAPGGGTGPIDPKRLPEGYPYKEKSETVIEWDGEHEGLPQLFGEVYKVSDALLTASSLIGQRFIFSDNQGNLLEDVVITEEMVSEIPGGNKGIYVQHNDYMMIASLFAEYNGSPAGTYFYHNNYGLHVSELNITTETIQPMDEEFMPLLTSPNGTKYKLTVSDDGTLSAVAVS